MTTLIDFQPSASAVFQFQPTLDGQVYQASVPWLAFGKRFYLLLQDLAGNTVLYTPLVGSPPAVAVASLSWAHGRATAALAAPHGWRPLDTVDVAVSDCSPTAYNGAVRALATDRSTLSWPLATDPGTATALGSVAYGIDLVGGYFSTSTLVYRESTQQFEVTP